MIMRAEAVAYWTHQISTGMRCAVCGMSGRCAFRLL